MSVVRWAVAVRWGDRCGARVLFYEGVECCLSTGVGIIGFDGWAACSLTAVGGYGDGELALQALAAEVEEEGVEAYDEEGE